MIFLDSWVWIEYFSENASKKVIDVVESNGIKIISTAAILEIKYRLSKLLGVEKAASILYLIESLENVKILPLTNDIAHLAADLRLKYYDHKSRDLSFIDTVNLATSIITGCGKFYTGDKDFHGINEIEVVSVR